MRQLFFNRPVSRSTGTLSEKRDWRHTLWLALLVVASMVFSLGLACAVPLAAFAAAAALSLSHRDALLLIALVWLTNQLVGFTLLDYPWTPSTFVWGAVLGVVAVLATLAAQWVVGRLSHARRALTGTATFLCAFAVYEGALFTVSATLLGGTEIYTAAIQGRIFAINAATFVGLLVLSQLVVLISLVGNRSIALPITTRSA
jgi:hypothetical protein